MSAYKNFGTKAIHAGLSPDVGTGAIMTPIFQTSTYQQESPGKHKGYEYARTQNPTRDALQNNLAALEQAKYALCFASGMAATDTILKLLKPGDHVVACNDLYGGTFRIFTKVFQPMGISFTFIDMNNEAELEKSIQPSTKLIWIETPTNPLLKIIDIEKVVQIARALSITTCVDNTFASPFLQNPLTMGVDLITHSITKYIAGHSDVVMGAVLCNDESLYTQLKFLQNACGAIPGPQDCFLVLRGIKTLHIRMERHCQNAMAVAQFLQNHSQVAQVNYPGLATHPQYELQKKQMRLPGGMVSFTLQNDSMDACLQTLERFKVFTLAESLGGVESLVGHPASMTHASIPKEDRLKAGLSDTLIRLSVGIEGIEDLIDDLDQALRK